MNTDLLGLRKNWWVVWRHVAPIRSALARAARQHWRPAVQRQLDKNRNTSERKTASSWEQLARLLNLNTANLYQWRGGKQAPALHAQDFLAMASMTGMPAEHLIPAPTLQLSWAVEILCGTTISDKEEPSPEAQAYSLYCHSVPVEWWEKAESQQLNSFALESVLAAGIFRDRADAIEAIINVGKKIQKKLEEAQGAT